MLIGVITGLIWWQSAGSDAEQGALFFFVAHMTWWPGFLYLFAFPAEVAVPLDKASASAAAQAVAQAAAILPAKAGTMCAAEAG